jgi:hypothetical protein
VLDELAGKRTALAATSATRSATTATETTRGAAQIYCAAFGEHLLEAGEHDGKLT